MIEPGPIRRTNLLDKLCFLVFGTGLSEHGRELHAALNEFCRFTGQEHVTVQAIRYWFEKGSTPKRATTFQFLLAYVESRDYGRLTPDQKKVQNQIVGYLQGAIRSTQPRTTPEYEPDRGKIYLSSGSRLVLSVAKAPEPELALKLLGTYLTYRMRLSEDKSEPIAQEVLHITRRGREVVFEHWYNREAADLQKFDGQVTTVGDHLWMMGAADRPPERLRILMFRNTASIQPKYEAYRWGMMLSDTSRPGSHEPAACRIFLVKVKDRVRDLPAFVKDNVRFVDVGRLDAAISAQVGRLVSNTNSAQSRHQSLDPVTGERGEPIVDSILRVDQGTLERAITTLP